MSVSKLPGLYEMHKKRTDGLILKSIQDDKVFFAASRAHVFTPLENITIYTDSEPIELIEVLRAIKKNESKNPVPSAKDDNEKLKAFFKSVVPNYDSEKVYTSDIQKITKWYTLLNEKGLIPLEEKIEKSKEEAEVKEEKTETKKIASEKKAKNTVTKETKTKTNSKPKAKTVSMPRKTK